MANESESDRIIRLFMEQQTCAQISPNRQSPYQPNGLYNCAQTYDQNTFQPRRSTDEEIMIHKLKEENQKLKEQYADLVRKSNILVDEYRKLEAENEVFKKKKAKRESRLNVFVEARKLAKKCVDKTVEWINT